MFLDWQEELKLWREFFFAVKSVRKVNSADSTIGVDGDSQSFNIIRAICPTSKVRQIELDLVPTWVKERVPSSNLIGIVQIKGLTLVVD